MKALSHSGAAAHLKLAKQLGLPSSTLEYRLKRLKERGILVGTRYLVNTFALGVQSFLLLVYLRGLHRELRDRIHRFCLKQKHIRFVVENIGGWDYEIGVEAQQPHQPVEVIQELYASFGSDVLTVKTLPVFGYPKVMNYPFSRFPLRSPAQGL